MNRREAIAALTSIPGLASIERADLTAKDVLVVSCTEYLSCETQERIKETLQRVWPDQKIVVLDRSLTLKVVRET